MAACTIIADLTVVLVLMTTHASAGESKIRAIQILHQDTGTRRSLDIFSFMTIGAVDFGVSTGQRKARLTVVDGFSVGLPMYEWEIFAIVLGMAA